MTPNSVTHNRQASERPVSGQGGAGPRNTPCAPPPAEAPASRRHAGPLPKAAADWFLGCKGARALRDGGGVGTGRFHHKPPACKWSLGTRERSGKERVSVNPEPVGACRKRHRRKAGPREEEVEKISRGRTEIRSRGLSALRMRRRLGARESSVSAGRSMR